MTKPDFGLMLEQARKNEVGLRLALGAWGGVKGTLPLQLVQLHNQTVEVILALEMYGRELEDDEEEEDLGSDLRAILAGEASEDVFQLEMKESKRDENRIDVPKHRWKDKL